MSTSRGIDRDRLGVLSGALLLGLALARFLDTPVLPFSTTFFGSAVGVNLSATTLLLLMATGLAISAVESLIRSHPLARQGEIQRTAIFWIMPTLLILGLAAWLADIQELSLWVFVLLMSAILIPLALVAEYASIDPNQRQLPLVIWGETILISLVALILFTRIYDLRVRALLSGTAIFFITSLLAARAFWFNRNDKSSNFLYGITAGVLTGLMAWVINYWPVTTFQGGSFLFLFFYVVVGLIQQQLRGQFSRRVVLEYTLFAGLGLFFIMLVL